MTKFHKIMSFSLLLVLAFLSVIFPSCGNKAATPEATKTTSATTAPVTAKSIIETNKTTTEKAPPDRDALNKIVVNAAQVTSKVDVLKYDFNIVMNIDVTGGSQAAKVNLEMSGNGSENHLNHNSLMKMKISTSTSTGTGTDSQAKMEIGMDMYIVDNILYMNLIMPVGAQWVKSKRTDALEQKLDLNMADEQLKLLNSTSNLTFLKFERIDDSPCYVINITPTTAALVSWMNEQQSSGSTGIDWSKVDISKVFKNIAYICWIAEDNNYLVRMDCDVLADLSYQDVGATISDFEKMTMGIKMSMNFYDYNKPTSIVLPPEAAGATEISPDTLLK